MHKAIRSLVFLIAMLFSDLSRAGSCDSTFVMGLRATIPRLSIVGGFADVNYNGKLDIVGRSDTIAGPFHVRYLSVFERDSGFSWREIHKGNGNHFPNWVGDSDHDGLVEVFMRNPSIDRLDLWESIDSTRLPLPPIDPWQQDSLGRIIWSYSMGGLGGDAQSPFVGDVDGNGRAEFIFYAGDSVGPTFDVWEIPANNTFRRFAGVRRLTSQWGSVIVGNFDDDGYPEFASGSQSGNVYIYEYQPPDSFALRQVLPAGAAYHGTLLHDVNRNGREEFVYGLGIPWMDFQLYTMFEATGNNQYAVIWRDTVYEFPLGLPVFRAGDLDGDGVEELVVYTDVALRAYKWYPQTGFRCVWRRHGGNENFRVFDSDNNGKSEIWVGNEPTYVYEFDGLTSVGREESAPSKTLALSQNYPNPFNARTRIRFALPR
ncbi:MAG: hypothetical protein HY708_01695, partial [Ignavibacteriae bacterium]|nr:hypothetical protein [Ignavibacteriota bacterium]